eukprot:1806711-Rhodomonas_salina.1
MQRGAMLPRVQARLGRRRCPLTHPPIPLLRHFNKLSHVLQPLPAPRPRTRESVPSGIAGYRTIIQH